MSAQSFHPYRTSPDTLDDIRHDLDGLFRSSVELVSITPPASLNAARALWMRQALEAAADHAAALLPLLDAPILVEPGVVSFDRSAALDALDAAVVALDALDNDPDLEDEPDDEATGDDELSLGWRVTASQATLDFGSNDGDATALERHGRGFFRSGPDDAEDGADAEPDEHHGGEDEPHPWRFERPHAVQRAAMLREVACNG